MRFSWTLTYVRSTADRRTQVMHACQEQAAVALLQNCASREGLTNAMGAAESTLALQRNEQKVRK